MGAQWGAPRRLLSLRASEGEELESMDVSAHVIDDSAIRSEYHIVDTLQGAKDAVRAMYEAPEGTVHACDTEVMDIDLSVEGPVGNGRVTCVSVYGGPGMDYGSGKGKAMWVDLLDGEPGIREVFKEWFEDPAQLKVWHNYGFDRHVLYNEGIDALGFAGDTFHMARLEDSSRDKISGHGKGYSLEALSSDLLQRRKAPMKEIFGVGKLRRDGTESTVLQIPPIEEMQRGVVNPNHRAQFIDYSAYDAMATWGLYDELKRRLSEVPWEGEYSMMHFYDRYLVPFGETLTDMERRGIHVAVEDLKRKEKQAKKDRDECLNQFREWAIKVAGPDAQYFNPQSSVQMQTFLFGGSAKKGSDGEVLPAVREMKVELTPEEVEELEQFEAALDAARCGDLRGSHTGAGAGAGAGTGAASFGAGANASPSPPAPASASAERLGLLRSRVLGALGELSREELAGAAKRLKLALPEGGSVAGAAETLVDAHVRASSTAEAAFLSIFSILSLVALKKVCGVLSLSKGGKKAEVVDRILAELMAPSVESPPPVVAVNKTSTTQQVVEFARTFRGFGEREDVLVDGLREVTMGKLKEVCAAFEIPKKGTKSEVIQRICRACREAPPTAAAPPPAFSAPAHGRGGESGEGQGGQPPTHEEDAAQRLSKLKVAQLKSLCTEAGVPASGTKAKLIERLVALRGAATPPPTTPAVPGASLRTEPPPRRRASGQRALHGQEFGAYADLSAAELKQCALARQLDPSMGRKRLISALAADDEFALELARHFNNNMGTREQPLPRPMWVRPHRGHGGSGSPDIGSISVGEGGEEDEEVVAVHSSARARVRTPSTTMVLPGPHLGRPETRRPLHTMSSAASIDGAATSFTTDSSEGEEDVCPPGVDPTYFAEMREKYRGVLGRRGGKRYRNITIQSLNLEPIKHTKGGLPAVSMDVLRSLAGTPKFDGTGLDPEQLGPAYEFFGGGEEGLEACQALDALCRMGSIDTMIGTFLEPLQALADENNRVHTSVNLNTETGRLSSKRPNLQNQPALEKDVYKIRESFDAEEGNMLIVADYGQLELRLLAHMTNCHSMIDAFASGGCFHSRTAVGMFDHVREAVDKGEVLLEWDYSKGDPPAPLVKDQYGSERRKAKTLNFSIAYGKTVFGLSKDWKVSTREAEDLLNAWYDDRPEVRAWQKDTIANARATGVTTTLMGRQRQLKGINERNGRMRGHMERAAINTPIQGGAADVVMMAMIKLNYSPDLARLGFKLLLQIHDEVILEGPEENVEEALRLVKHIMENPWDEDGIGLQPLQVSLDVDGKYAKNWYLAK